ncbi:helix-turn-helix transcriptional regulator [Streptomyces sp. NPDC007988]|uniref:PadR family transcriptional regulator n=1 Tax=Streptomyces sp. NPDC007988 TaxID=3364802 RepID=UPI0036E70F60
MPISVSSLPEVARVREFQRGAVRLHILYHAAEEEIHGAWMTEELASHGYRISPGTLYPTLHRLEAEGLLVSEQRVVDGRTRRVYKATEAGKQGKKGLRKITSAAHAPHQLTPSARLCPGASSANSSSRGTGPSSWSCRRSPGPSPLSGLPSSSSTGSASARRPARSWSGHRS